MSTVSEIIRELINSLTLKSNLAIYLFQTNSVSQLGVTIDCRLSFEKHVSYLCKTGASQLIALKRLHPYITHQSTQKILIQSFVLSCFNYCPLVWYFTTAKQLQKIEKIQERALRFITDDYLSPYETHDKNRDG